MFIRKKEKADLNQNDKEDAYLVLSDMIVKNICPDQFTYPILTKGVCGNGYQSPALKLNNQIMGKNLPAYSFPHIILINYIKTHLPVKKIILRPICTAIIYIKNSFAL